MLKLDINEAVCSYMTRGIISVESSAMIRDAAKIMVETNASILLITKNKEPVGTIIERDIILKTVIDDIDPDIKLKNMTLSPIITVFETDTIREALTLMADKNVDHLIVKNEGKLVGVFSKSNLLEIGKLKI